MTTVVVTPPESNFVPLAPGDWLPDIPLPTNKGLPSALNLVPKSNGLYGPEKGPVVFSSQSTTLFANAIKAHGQLHSVPGQAGGTEPRRYVGTLGNAAGESRILTRPEQGAWTDVSKAGAYTISSADPWQFANFGNLVIAGNRGTRTQLSDGGGAAFADITNAPNARFLAEVDGFLMLADIIDNVYGEGTQPFRLWWSAIGDPSNFPDPTSNTAINVQSGFQDLFGGGRIRGIIPGIGGSAAIIVAERRMWRCNFVGPPQIFRFDLIESDQGASIPGAIAAHNETFFFLGQNGFYWFDGQNATPIGQGEMDEFFEGDVQFVGAFGGRNAVVASVDSINKNYVVSYRSRDAVDDRNDSILRFNWITGKWSNSKQSIEVMGQVDSEFTRTDSTDFQIMGGDHEIAQLVGATLEVTIETGESFARDLSITLIKSFLPLIDSNEVQAQILVRDQLSQIAFETTERGFSDHGVIPFDIENVNGRYYACRMRIPAGATWTYYQGGFYETAPFGYGSRSGQGGV